MLQSEILLAQIAGALGGCGLAPGSVNCRQNETGKNADDCDNDEQFSQSKSIPRTVSGLALPQGARRRREPDLVDQLEIDRLARLEIDLKKHGAPLTVIG